MSFYVLREFDPWKNPLCTCPKKYSLSPYTGCSHKCLYCYATSYIGYKDSQPKKDFLIKLEKDLRRADKRLYISMANSSDPYPPIENKLELTRRTIELIKKYDFGLLILTKSDLVKRDAEILKDMKAAVSITITCLDTKLAKRIEPYAPSPNRRLRAVKYLSRFGVPVIVRIDPILPGINDDEFMLRELVDKVVEYGAKHIVTSTYKAKPDNFSRILAEFPELEKKYVELYKIKGKWIKGYWYLPEEIRKELLFPVCDEARKLGITYATCREGFKNDKNYFNAPTCDGSHLIWKK